MQRLYWLGAGRGAMARNEAALREGGDLYVSCRRWSDVVGDVASGSGAGGGGGGGSSTTTTTASAAAADVHSSGGHSVRVGIDIGGVIIEKSDRCSKAASLFSPSLPSVYRAPLM